MLFLLFELAFIVVISQLFDVGDFRIVNRPLACCGGLSPEISLSHFIQDSHMYAVPFFSGFLKENMLERRKT